MYINMVTFLGSTFSRIENSFTAFTQQQSSEQQDKDLSQNNDQDIPVSNNSEVDQLKIIMMSILKSVLVKKYKDL